MIIGKNGTTLSATSSGKITFGVVTRTTSDWVAVGFNDQSQGMKGTDVVMHRYKEDKKAKTKVN